MGFLYFLIFVFIILVPLVLANIIPAYQNHRKVTGDVINYDSSMRKFVYKVCMSREEIIDALKMKNSGDDLSCTFDFERSVILFSEYGSSREYFFEIQEFDGFSILRLNQAALIGERSNLPFKINSFLGKKIQAEMIPFAQYGV